MENNSLSWVCLWTVFNNLEKKQVLSNVEKQIVKNNIYIHEKKKKKENFFYCDTHLAPKSYRLIWVLFNCYMSW